MKYLLPLLLLLITPVSAYLDTSNLIMESSIYRPNIYLKYAHPDLISCVSCNGTTTLDYFTRGYAECFSRSYDICINSTHVKQFYCNGTRHSQIDRCPGLNRCFEGVCMWVPDLELVHIDYSPSDIGLREYVDVQVEVKNIGPVDSQTVNLTIFWSCDPVTIRLDPLVKNTSVVVNFTNALIFQYAGDNEFTAFVDSGYEQVELNESNNMMSKTIWVDLPGGLETPGPAIDFGSEPITPISCIQTPQTAIGRVKNPLGDYYRDSSGKLLTSVKAGPWNAEPAKNRFPYADFSFTINETTGFVQYNDNSTDHDGSIVSHSWDLGDGTVSTFSSLNHTYSPGFYLVSLTVTDDAGESSYVQKSILISDSSNDIVRAEFVTSFYAGANMNVWDVSGRKDDYIISKYQYIIPGVGTYSQEDLYLQYPRLGVFNITHYVEDIRGLNSSVTRTVQAESIWLPGQGAENSCGSTSLAYTLRYLLNDDRYNKDIVDDEIRASEPEHSFGSDAGMFSEPVGLVQYAKAQGLNAELYQNGDLDEVKRFVDRGIPVLLDISTQGDGNVVSGHWIVVISYCQRETTTPGVYETVFGIYNPWGYQYEIEQSRLQSYWGEMNLGGIKLWDRVYIAVSTESLPAGNLDGIKTELATAQAIAMMTNGADDFADGEIFEGLIEMTGGAVSTLVGGLSHILLGWGGYTDEVPLIGPIFGAVDESIGGILLSTNEFINEFADSFQNIIENWYNPLILLAEIGRMIAEAFEMLWEVFLVALELILDILIAIGEFIIEIFKAIGEFFCWLFGLDCHPTKCVLEQMVSSDACGETNTFINGMQRYATIGYIDLEHSTGTSPLYLYAHTNIEGDIFDYKVSKDQNLGYTHPDYIRIKTIGYSYDVCPNNCYDLTVGLNDYNLTFGENLGFAPYGYVNGSVIIWLFKDLASSNFTVGTEPCAGTRTFMSQTMDKYSRQKVVGYMRLTPHPQAQKIFRYYNKDKKDFFLSTNSLETDSNYVLSGMLGYAYTTPTNETVPLYSYSTKNYEKLNITI